MSREPDFTQQAISKISGLTYHYRDAAKPARLRSATQQRRGDVCCLVRPDGYLAMRGRFTDLPGLLAALTGYLW